MHVRLARLTDLPSLAPLDLAAQRAEAASVYAEHSPEGSIPDDVARRALEHHRILVAESGEAVIGWVYLTRSGDELCIGHVVVHPDYQQRGVGSSLLDRVLTDAQERGECSVVLTTRSGVPYNQPWYERFGFAVVAESEWTDDQHAIKRELLAAGLDWTHRVHMRLTL